MIKGSYDEAVVHFLSQKENLSFALEICDAVPGIKKHLLETFWNAVKSRIQSEVNCSKCWGMTADKHISNTNNNGIYLYPEGCSRLPFILGNDREKLFIGTKNVHDLDLICANDFFQKQEEEGFSSSVSFGNWKFFQTLDNNFFIRLSSNVDGAADEVSSLFLAYANQNRDQLIEVNTLLDEAAKAL